MGGDVDKDGSYSSTLKDQTIKTTTQRKSRDKGPKTALKIPVLIATRVYQYGDGHQPLDIPLRLYTT